jgi:hypothetical protein
MCTSSFSFVSTYACAPAVFDTDVNAISGNGTLEFRDNNTVVTSTNGSHAVCLLSHGGFKSGKVCTRACDPFR